MTEHFSMGGEIFHIPPLGAFGITQKYFWLSQLGVERGCYWHLVG